MKAQVDVTLGRSHKFYELAERLDELIRSIDMDADTDMALTNLIDMQIRTAERDAFMFGFDMASEIRKEYYEED